jgi:curved DNA-binding protein
MDYYDILGVPHTATSDEIKKAYRKLAMQHHPDKGGDPAHFQQINAAYETLKDSNKRAKYDMFRNSPNVKDFSFYNVGPEIHDINELFEHFFGSHFNQQFRYGNVNTRQVMRTTLAISLQEAYTGTEKIIQLRTQNENKVISIKVAPGIKTGDQIRYDNVIEGVILLVNFHVMEDLKFTRNGNDLYCTFPISVLDLIVGKTIKFKTIDEKEIEVTIPPYMQLTKNIRIPGKGMPIYGSINMYGDQYIILKPFVPKNLPEDLYNAIKKYSLENKE